MWWFYCVGWQAAQARLGEALASREGFRKALTYFEECLIVFLFYSPHIIVILLFLMPYVPPAPSSKRTLINAPPCLPLTLFHSKLRNRDHRNRKIPRNDA